MSFQASKGLYWKIITLAHLQSNIQSWGWVKLTLSKAPSMFCFFSVLLMSSGCRSQQILSSVQDQGWSWDEKIKGRCPCKVALVWVMNITVLKHELAFMCMSQRDISSEATNRLCKAAESLSKEVLPCWPLELASAPEEKMIWMETSPYSLFLCLGSGRGGLREGALGWWRHLGSGQSDTEIIPLLLLQFN